MEFYYGKRYAFYTLGKDKELNKKMLSQQFIQPFLIVEQQNYVIYEYFAQQQIRLDELILSLQNISFSIKQIVTILDQVQEQFEIIYKDGFSLQNLSLSNVIIIPQVSKLNYKEPLSKLQVLLIGLQYFKPQAVNQEKKAGLIKNLYRLIIKHYEKSYLNRPQFEQLRYSWLQFKSELFQSDNYGDFLKQFMKFYKSDSKFEQFLFESNSHKNNEIKVTEDQLRTLNSFVNQNEVNLMKQLDKYNNKLSLLLISNIQSYLYQNLLQSIIEYSQNAGYFTSFDINKTLQKINIQIQEIKNLLQIENKFLECVFQQIYDQSLSIKEHFSKYIHIQKNWFTTLNHENLLNDYLLVAAKSEKLNNYKNFRIILEYLQSQRAQQNDQQLKPNIMQVQYFESYIIEKLDEYFINQIEKKFDTFD